MENKTNLTVGKKIALAVGAVILVGGLTAGTIYLMNTQSTTVSTVASNTTISLKDGENKIKAGGTYTFTGSTANGKIEVDTADDVKVILQGVSITNPVGAAIKSKGTGKLTVELLGDNTLITTDNTADDPATAISGDADLEITGTGSATVKSNGKGVKADGTLTLTSGTLAVTSPDDAIHSNSNIMIVNGSYTLNTGDDAVHADGTLKIFDGKLTIEKAHEGLEANIIEIMDGDISIVADDDAINAQNSDGTSRVGVVGDGVLNIAGGKIYVNSGGDGLDSNGSITIAGGEIYVDGPLNDGNGAVDCDGEINITGGTLIAVGSAGMVQNATTATQPSVLINLSTNYSGELSFGNITYTPTKKYRSVLISSSELKIGETYQLAIAGDNVQSVTITQNIVGQGNGMMSGGGPQLMMQSPQPAQGRVR